MTREELLADRQTGVGGSDAASVMNQGYGCRRRLWYEKRGVAPDYPREELPIMRRGSKLEEIIRQEYREATGGRAVHLADVQRNRDYEFLLVHPDGLILDGLVFDEPNDQLDLRTGVLEIKTMGEWMFRRAKREGLPIDYALQLQWALMVTGFSWGSFAIFHPDSWSLLWFDMERDAELCKVLLREGVAFWGLVENGPEPERLDAADRRCRDCGWRTQCQGERLLEAAKAEPVDGEVPYDVSLAGLVKEYRQAAEIEAEATELLEGVKNRLKVALGDRQVVDTHGARIYFRATPYKEYTVRASVRRPLRIFAK